MSIEEIHAYTHIDPFFLYNLKEIVDFEKTLSGSDARQQIKEVTSNQWPVTGKETPRTGNYKLVTDNLKKAKQYGF